MFLYFSNFYNSPRCYTERYICFEVILNNNNVTGLDHCCGDNPSHPILIAVPYSIFDPEKHNKPGSEVGSLNTTVYPVGFELANKNVTPQSIRLLSVSLI